MLSENAARIKPARIKLDLNNETPGRFLYAWSKTCCVFPSCHRDDGISRYVSGLPTQAHALKNSQNKQSRIRFTDCNGLGFVLELSGLQFLLALSKHVLFLSELS